MILATDTYYHPDGTAKAVGVLFHDWTDAEPARVIEVNIPAVEDYEPGAFYKRELPCILAVLAACELVELDLIVIDGYVILNDSGKPGLGVYLYEALQRRIPVIGVAKTSFFENTVHVAEVLRGDSTKPLFVTSIGVDLNEAARAVQSMHGEFRMPYLLKLLDGVTRAI
jgi:deoxyribonuclease V